MDLRKCQMTLCHLFVYSLPYISKTRVSASSLKSVSQSLSLKAARYPALLERLCFHTGFFAHIPESFHCNGRPFHHNGRTFHCNGRPFHHNGRTFHCNGRPFHHNGRTFRYDGEPLCCCGRYSKLFIIRTYHRRFASMFSINAARCGLKGV